MTQYLRAFAGTVFGFLLLDLLWIRFFVKPLYEQEVGGLLREAPDLTAAVAFYLCYNAATVYFAVLPALKVASMRVALLNGALLGGITYATYSMTNYAVLSDWTSILVLTDVPWGIFLTAFTAVCGYMAAGKTAEMDNL